MYKQVHSSQKSLHLLSFIAASCLNALKIFIIFALPIIQNSGN